MNKKVRKPLTHHQQRFLLRIILVLVIFATSWLVFVPNMGVIALYRQNSELKQLVSEKERLRQENDKLRQEIERIQNDVEYFEKLAREKHNLLKKNEILFDFSKNGNASK